MKYAPNSTVEALKITAVILAGSQVSEHGNTLVATLTLENGTTFKADRTHGTGRFVPKVGDYVVTRLADKFTYLSRADWFESRFTPNEKPS